MLSRGGRSEAVARKLLNSFRTSLADPFPFVFFRPGEMLLVLGRPGSGCSTMLKVLAAYTDSYRAIEGTISYDGMSAEELRKHHKAEAAYLPEDDKVSTVRSSDL